MKKKDIELFDKAIHQVKYLIKEISDERKSYIRETGALRRKYRKTMDNHIKEGKEIVSELYELYDHLSDKYV